MAEYKITTHATGNGWYTAEINGTPLLGEKGDYSRFPSRKEAKEAARHRLNELTDKERSTLLTGE